MKIILEFPKSLALRLGGRCELAIVLKALDFAIRPSTMQRDLRNFRRTEHPRRAPRLDRGVSRHRRITRQCDSE
jgi:hypothetical protein